METSSLQNRRHSPHSYLCGIHSSWSIRSFSALMVGVSENFVHARSLRKQRARLRHHHGLRRHHCFPVHDGRHRSPAGFQACTICRYRQDTARHTPPMPSSCSALIAVLMAADSLFAAQWPPVKSQPGHSLKVLAAFCPCPGCCRTALLSAPLATLGKFYFGAYLVHEVAFISCSVTGPFGIQFHVETSLFNVYFAKLDRGTLKPVRWGVSRRATGSGENLRREDVRRFHLEAHAGFLLLRRLRPLLGQLSRQRRRTAALAAISHHQGAGLLLPALSGVRQARATASR